MNTFKEARDRILNAYFKNEIDPYINCACFVGNLLGRNAEWGLHRTRDTILIGEGKSTENYEEWYNAHEPHMLRLGKILLNIYGYTPEDVTKLENMFLSTYQEIEDWPGTNKEEAIFVAMDKTLDLLQSIHEEKGEIIDFIPKFPKRNLEVSNKALALQD